MSEPEIISPIRVAPGKHYFVDPSGTPEFWLGDTQWELFRLFDVNRGLKILWDRQSKGFNVILIMLLGVETGRVLPNQPTDYANLEGENPWLGGDPLRPNEMYFRHVDEMIRLGELTGQTFVVGIYHQWHFEVITMSNARHWARWVARRYRDVPNLIWSMYPQATETYIPVCRELAAGLQEGDGGRHLICVHPDPSVASSSFLHEESWLAFNMIQTCITFDQIYSAVTADYRRKPVKPVVMAEGGYEGLEFDRLQTPHDIRKQAYWTHLAGGHYVYGHNDAWSAPSKWQEWIGAPGAEQLKVFRNVMTSLDGWWDLIPDQSVFLAGEGRGYGLNTAARSAEGRWLLAYLSEPGAVVLRLTALSAERRLWANWISPITGYRLEAGAVNRDQAAAFSTPPGWEDALLLIEVEG